MVKTDAKDGDVYRGFDPDLIKDFIANIKLEDQIVAIDNGFGSIRICPSDKRFSPATNTTL